MAIINASTSAGLVNTGDTDGTINLQNNGTTAMTVTGGNVGIGNTSPDCQLSLKGSTDGVNSTLGLWNTGASGHIWKVTSRSDGSLRFADDTAAAERMRITSAGDVLVGCTTANAVGLTLDAPDNGGIYLNTATTGARNQIRFVNPNGTVGSIQTSGSATSYNTSSDYRLKENIAPMTGALAKVSALKPVTYTWKTDGSNGQGFIAHELAEVVPDCVTGEKDAVDVEGNPEYQAIDTSFLVATLTAAIQELKAELDATKAEVAALKGTV